MYTFIKAQNISERIHKKLELWLPVEVWWDEEDAWKDRNLFEFIIHMFYLLNKKSKTIRKKSPSNPFLKVTRQNTTGLWGQAG